MRLSILVFFFLAFSTSVSYAQSENDAIASVLDRLFQGMKQSDTTLMRTCFAGSATMQSVSNGKDGNTILATPTVGQFLQAIAMVSKGDADERILIKDIQQNGILASVWATYQFYYKGNFSHCGIDAFQLVKLNNEWKIVQIIDTRSKTDCQQ